MGIPSCGSIVRIPIVGISSCGFHRPDSHCADSYRRKFIVWMSSSGFLLCGLDCGDFVVQILSCRFLLYGFPSCELFLCSRLLDYSFTQRWLLSRIWKLGNSSCFISTSSFFSSCHRFIANGETDKIIEEDCFINKDALRPGS